MMCFLLQRVKFLQVSLYFCFNTFHINGKLRVGKLTVSFLNGFLYTLNILQLLLNILFSYIENLSSIPKSKPQIQLFLQIVKVIQLIVKSYTQIVKVMCQSKHLWTYCFFNFFLFGPFQSICIIERSIGFNFFEINPLYC